MLRFEIAVLVTLFHARVENDRLALVRAIPLRASVHTARQVVAVIYDDIAGATIIVACDPRRHVVARRERAIIARVVESRDARYCKMRLYRASSGRFRSVRGRLGIAVTKTVFHTWVVCYRFAQFELLLAAEAQAFLERVGMQWPIP